MGFTPAVSDEGKQEIRDKVKKIRMKNKTASVERMAALINPVVRGWYNYYGKYSPGLAKRALTIVNPVLVQWSRKLITNP